VLSLVFAQFLPVKKVGVQSSKWERGAGSLPGLLAKMDLPPELEDLPSSVASRLLIVPPAPPPAAASPPPADDVPALAEEMQKAALAARREADAARSTAELKAAGSGIGGDAPGSVMGKGFLMRASQTTRKDGGGGAAPAPAPAPGPSADELRGMTAKQLKAVLDARGVRHAHCVEKSELLELALSAPAAAPAAPAPAAPAPAPSSTVRGPVDLRVVGGAAGGGSSGGGGGGGSRAAAPVLPDVQRAMAERAPAMAAKLKGGSWMTPELMARIAAEPRLLAGMQQPRFMAALTEMQKDPAGTLKRHEGDAALLDFLRAFMGVLGDHFEKLGAAEDAAKRAEGGGGGGSDGGGGGIGLTPAASTKKKAPPSAEAIAAAVAAGAAGEVADAEVRAALSNAEVVALLQDEEMKRVLQECQAEPHALPRYMAQPKVRLKLLRMQELGLIMLPRF
jgi:hypothetical protein